MKSRNRISPEEYLAIERKADYRSEYFDGEMFAMAGASRSHNRIVTNLVSGLDVQLKTRQCNVYSSDMRVNVPQTSLFTYPDVVVTCGEERFTDDEYDVLLNPNLIIEVLSDSTEAYDRGKKIFHYQQIDSLSEYLLVSQHVQRVERFAKQNATQWLYTDFRAPGEEIRMPSIACSLTLQEIYHKVESHPLGALR